MIDYNAIVQLVGGVGFPIVACCAMAYYIKTTHKELTDALYNNTRAITALMAKLDINEEDLKR